jgi:DNA-binding MarR family transcriptional regulator
MIHSNSREAYAKLTPRLSAKQIEVLQVIKAKGSITRQDISAELGVEINTVTPRVCELLEIGRIVRDGNDTSHSVKRGLLRVSA